MTKTPNRLLRSSLLLIFFMYFLPAGTCAQQILPLYPQTIPNSIATANKEVSGQGEIISRVSVPELIAYVAPAAIANRTAIIICPGGGYGVLVMDREGKGIAKTLNKSGVTCFVLKYRLPDSATMTDPSIGPIQDAQQAIKMVRENADKWNIDPQKIGIMGFSAGGHLAATAGTHYSKSYIDNSAQTSLRPDFMMLIYPVISMDDSLTHAGSKKNLLGSHPSAAKIQAFSNEGQVDDNTPPTFLMHASDDEMVKPGNAIAFYDALVKHHVPAGMHIFPHGRHGFLQEPARSVYLDYCLSWLRENGWLDVPKRVTATTTEGIRLFQTPTSVIRDSL